MNSGRFLRHLLQPRGVVSNALTSSLSPISPQSILPVTVTSSHSFTSQPYNTILVFVPHQQAWVVERMGKFHMTLDSGPHLLIPVLDRIKYVQSLKELAIDIPSQSAISADNVALQMDAVLYVRVFDPYKASYGVEDPEFAITQLAQTTMRSEVGKIELDAVFRERERLNDKIVASLHSAAEPWGIRCMRYEIRDMKMPPKIAEAMQMQVEAERRKRASVLESEGVRLAAINVAEGEKQSTILASEADKLQKINRAQGEAEALVAKSNARAAAIKVVAEQLGQMNGQNAAALGIAEQYVAAFSEMAKESNTMIVPANAADAASSIAQALSVYNKVSTTTEQVLKPDIKSITTNQSH